jgi:hypothetical protein
MKDDEIELTVIISVTLEKNVLTIKVNGVDTLKKGNNVGEECG